VFVTDPGAERAVDLMRDLAGRDVAIHSVTDRVMKALGDTVTPQGVVGVVAQPMAGWDGLPPAPHLVALLDQCADPGNAGTVIRTCDAAGADAVVFSAGSVDVWGSKVVRASAGSVFNLPVISNVGSADAVTSLRTAGCTVLATTVDGTADLDDLITDGGLDGPVAWLFGNEAHGLDPVLAAAADRTVRIPIHGRAESLNLASTVAICMYAAARAQRRGSPAQS
jgi:TrmH family RNA methyltransferase